MRKTEANGKWRSSRGTAAGCNNFGRYAYNPRFVLTVNEGTGTDTIVRLQTRGMDPIPALNVSLFSSDASGSLDGKSTPTDSHLNCTSNRGVYVNTLSGVVTPRTFLRPGCYAIVPSTFKPTEGSFNLTIYSTTEISVRQVL